MSSRRRRQPVSSRTEPHQDTRRQPSWGARRQDCANNARQKPAATFKNMRLRLFLAKGYESTTVAEIAAAAGVSHMTFFRYFPTKESVVEDDEYDPILVDLIRNRPDDEDPLTALRTAIREGLAVIYPAARDVAADSHSADPAHAGPTRQDGRQSQGHRTAARRGPREPPPDRRHLADPSPRRRVRGHTHYRDHDLGEQ